MHKTQFKLPRIGGNEAEAKILAWKKTPGERFAAGDILLEVETDKAVVDVPASANGVMGQPLKQPDDYAAFDEALAEVELDVAPATAPAAAPPTLDDEPSPAAPPPGTAAAPARPAGSRVVASPAARRQARAAGIDLAGLHGSGPGGRVVLRDLPGAPPSAADCGLVQVPSGRFQVRHWNRGAAGRQSGFVLIHGLFGDLDTWAGLAAGLAGSGRPVFAFDLPLHGQTTVEATSLDELTAAVRPLIEREMAGPYRLVGHSLGGAVALRLAQAGAARLQGLTLIAPAGLGSEIDQSFIDGMLNASQPLLLRRELAKLTRRPQPFGDTWLTGLHTDLQRRSSALQALTSQLALRGIQQIDLAAALDALTLPVAVLWGRHDRIIPWQQALDLPPQVALHLFSESGHMPQAEQTCVVSRLLLQAD